MKEFSNKTLITIALISIAISLFNIILPFGDKLSITGFVTETGEGYVNVTVPTTASIIVWTKSINFTITNPGETKNSYESADVDTRDGMPCTTDNHCGMNITNEGGNFINITLYASEALFTSGTYTANTHFLYNVTMQDPDYGGATYGAKSNCSVGYDQGLPGVGGWGYWRGVPTVAEDAVCYLNYSDTLGGAATESSDTRPDVARIEFNITVPNDEPEGYKAGTITFTAVASVTS